MVGGRLEVLAEVHLEGRFPVPEHIVGCADARRDVIGPDDTPLLGKHNGRRKELHRTHLLFRKVAPRVLVANGPLERQPARGPLLLGVRRLVPGAPLQAERIEIHRELVRNAVVEAVLQVRVVAEVVRVGDVERAHVAELHVLRARDVRGGAAPGRLQPLIVHEVLRSVRQALDAAVVGTSGGALFHQPRNVDRPVSRNLLPAVPAEGAPDRGLEKELVGDR